MSTAENGLKGRFMKSDCTTSLGSTASGRPQHSRRFNSHANRKVSRSRNALHLEIGVSSATTESSVSRLIA